jgi:lipopolysaccharide/colanic/teichoic acid biosynthesis glycosyltransferase
MSSPSQSRIILSEASLPTSLPLVSTDYKVPLLYRCFEIIVAAGSLLLCAPFLLVIALVIRMGTPGPLLFFQDRIGCNGKPFRFVKFRTLYANAKQRFPHLYAYKYSEQELLTLKFKVSNDPRVTPQGAWLRRSSFDELPNFWNVLTGDMALVGPRPEIPEMLPYYRGEMLRKFGVRPGITGLAQTSGRGRLGFFETVAYDLEYVEKRSISYDLKIMLKTIRMVFLRDGAF